MQNRTAAEKKANLTKTTLSASTAADQPMTALGQPRTILVEIEGHMLCRNELVQTYPEFYLPTMVSAAINRNERCQRQLCSSGKRMYFEREDGVKFLGAGWDADIWNSRVAIQWRRQFSGNKFGAWGLRRCRENYGMKGCLKCARAGDQTEPGPE